MGSESSYFHRRTKMQKQIVCATPYVSTLILKLQPFFGVDSLFLTKFESESLSWKLWAEYQWLKNLSFFWIITYKWLENRYGLYVILHNLLLCRTKSKNGPSWCYMASGQSCISPVNSLVPCWYMQFHRPKLWKLDSYHFLVRMLLMKGPISANTSSFRYKHLN